MKALCTINSKALVSGLVLVLMLSAGLSANGDGVVHPSNEWVNIYGDACLLNGSALPIGAIVDAYDSSGVYCGSDTVKESGIYGLMPVYRDYHDLDPQADTIDEGCEPGDTITLKINGRPTQELGPDVPVWTEKGDYFKVNLSATQDIALDVISPDGEITAPLNVVSYNFKIVNTGNGIDLFGLSASSEHGWTTQVTSANPTEHAHPGDTLDVTVEIEVPGGIFTSMVDTLFLEATSYMDGAVTVTGKTITNVIVVSAEDDNSDLLPEKFTLEQNYPNPFNPWTVISYSLKKRGNVRLEVYNLLGQLAEVLVDNYQDAGEYTVIWDTYEAGKNYPSGVYFYRLTVDEITSVSYTHLRAHET